MSGTGLGARRRALAAGLALALGWALPALAAQWVVGHYGPEGHWIPGHWVGGVGPAPGPGEGPPPGVAPAGRVWVPGYYGTGGRWHPGHWRVV